MASSAPGNNGGSTVFQSLYRAVYVSCQYKRGNTELFHVITTRRRDQQQPEIRLHSQAKSPQVITYVSLLFEVLETSTSEIPSSQELFTLGLEVCGRPCVRFFFFHIWSKKGPSELGGLIADSKWCPGTAVSLKAIKVTGRNH